MRNKTLLLIFLISTVPAAARAFSSSGFNTPESMQVDPEDGAYYISNLHGDPVEKDGNGYISKISANGNTVIQKYIGGNPKEPSLHAPKGLLITKNRIFVTDVDAVKVFEKKSGKRLVVVDLAPLGSKFANDIAENSNGVLYVSDMLANKIFRIDPEKNYEVTVFKEGEILGQPNGLMINPRTGNLMVVTWKSGEILEIDGSGRVHRLKRGLKNLDGIDFDLDGSIYVSSFEKGEIYRIPFYGRGTLTPFLSGLLTPADISCDRKKREILIPSFKGNSVSTKELPQKKNEDLKSATAPVKNPPDQSKNREKIKKTVFTNISKKTRHRDL